LQYSFAKQPAICIAGTTVTALPGESAHVDENRRTDPG
jgi:hypothetical protein